MIVPKIKTEDYATTTQAAEALGLSTESVGIYCANALTEDRHPRLAAIKIGRQWLIPWKEIRRYQKERKPVGRPVEE